MNVLTLYIATVLADDAGHHGLAQFGQVVCIIWLILWFIGFLAALASD